jgi:hypothetical protein
VGFPRTPAAALVAVSPLYGTFMILQGQKDALHAASVSYPEKFRAERIPYRKSFEYLNNHSEVAKVLILDRSVPPFYSEKAYVKPFGHWGELTVPGIGTLHRLLRPRKRLELRMFWT